MTGHRLTDQEIADALLRDGGSRRAASEVKQGSSLRDVVGPDCIREDRMWDLARGVLDPHETTAILDHTLQCAECTLALRLAHETFAASGMASESPRAAGSSTRFWDQLAGSLLRPEFALVYLLLLVVSFPAYRLLAPGAIAPALPPGPGIQKPEPGSAIDHPSSGLSVLRVLRLTGDLKLRSGSSQVVPPSVRLGEGEALELKLFLDAEDLPKDPRAGIIVRVLDGDRTVGSTIRNVSDLGEDQSLSLVLDREHLHPGTTYVVEVAPAPPEGGSRPITPPGRSGPTAVPAPIFKQSFTLEPG